MAYRTSFKKLSILAVFCGLILPGSALALEDSFPVKVYPSDAEPMLIEHFTMSGRPKFFAGWRGGFVGLSFQDIQTVQYLEPGNQAYPVEVTFRDGRKEKFAFMPGILQGESEFGEWSMHPEKAVRIEFGPAEAARMKTSSGYSNVDQIILRNGDVVSGKVQTSAFRLRTAYATLNLETPQIGYIDFQGGAQDRDVVGLRAGDNLSGVLEAGTIKLLMKTGKEVNLDKSKIKQIHFVLVKK